MYFWIYSLLVEKKKNQQQPNASFYWKAQVSLGNNYLLHLYSFQL